MNSLRKDTGLEISDRIRLWLTSGDADLMVDAERIGAEMLAIAVDVGDGELRIEKV